MAKIKDGTLKPVKNFKVNPRKQMESNDALAALGIEFTPAGQTPLKINRADQKDIPKQQQQHRPQPPIDANEKKSSKPTPPFTSSDQRKPTDKKPGDKFVHPPRKGPDKEDLGKVLADALKDAGKLFPAKDAKPDTGVEKTVATPVVPVVPPAVSLSMLKSQSAPVTSTFSKKEQSEENKDELRKVLAGLMSKKGGSSQEHEHTDAKIQEPAIAQIVEAEDRAFREAEADTVDEVKDIIDQEQERQRKESELALARQREREEQDKREREEAQAREKAQREEKERQEKLEQEIRERRERIERERKELEEKLAREKEERERQQAIARAEEEKKREIARQKEEAEAKRIREELQAATAQKEAAEAKKRAEELAQQEADREAEAWLRNQKERRVYTDREGKVVPPVSSPDPIEEESDTSTPTAKGVGKKKKEVPEDLLRQILG